MLRTQELIDWLKVNKIKFRIADKKQSVFIFQEKAYLLIAEKNGIILDSELNLILDSSEKDYQVDGYIFNFGGKFFYSKTSDNVKLKLLKYIGEADQEVTFDFTHLGVHGPYEMLNGAFQYEEWVEKAKFLGHSALGICEKNTLAGILQFQKACKEGGIKPIIGETITVKYGNNYDFKVYILNEEGYKNLLKINKEINIVNEKYIDYHTFLKYSRGLICIIPNNFIEINRIQDSIKELGASFEGVYYQIDTVIWDNKHFYKTYLENIKFYLENLYPNLQPILINDSYYLDESDWEIKKILNQIAGEGFQNTSRDQFFKNLDESFLILEKYFKSDDNRLLDLFQKAIQVTQDIGKEAEFKIKTGVFHLPKFKQDHLPQDFQRETNEDLINLLIDIGLRKKKLVGRTEYLDRIDIELAVIKKGGFIDYFLILWDIIRFCKEKKILTGLGRGSAAGSLISYLLDITKIDPLKHDLLFERFMNEGRLTSPPDIDTDISTSRRDEVFQYVKKLYGEEYFCQVGTYTTLKIKSGLKDLSKLKGLDYEYYNYITTTLLKFQEGKDANIEELFKKGIEIPTVREYIQKNVDLIHNLFRILDQPKAVSIHPCATIIVPTENGTVFDNIPVRKDGETIISEFQGPDLEEMGYLKEDLLALLQLDKFERMLSLIKENTGQEINIYTIPLNDPQVMDMFQQGLNGDIFQFNTKGIASLCKQVKPDGLTDLINMVALYRPGPIGSGAHYRYVNLKHKKAEPEYDFGLEEVTKETFGLIIFQEQVMKACQVLGGFSLRETDDVRRAMGKKKEHVLLPFREQFVKGAITQGATQEQAEEIWDKLIVFSAYGFNKSHAAVYSITGYISQWFKTYYPLEFWTTALEYTKEDEDIIAYVQEINKKGDILIVPPDINKSEIGFRTDPVTKRIYWSILKIKFLGDVGTTSLLGERNKNGKYFSIEEFYTRIKDSSLDKRMISNLIFSGCFDEICGIRNVKERVNLLKEYFQIAGIDQNKELWLQDKGIKYEWWWSLKQRELTGLGLFDYKQMILDSKLQNWYAHYVDAIGVSEASEGDKISFGGIVKTYNVRKSKNGPWLALTLDSNGEEVDICIWNPEYEKYKDQLGQQKLEKNILLLTGVVRKNKDKMVIHFYESENDVFDIRGFEDLSQYKPIKVEYKAGDIREFKDGKYQLNQQGQWKKIKPQ